MKLNFKGAKHGVTGLTRSAALAYSAQGIRINSILLSEGASFMTGSALVVDGGYTAA